jgi:uncharacterized protein Yka (UPF0111/DUF47 family)
MDWGTVLSLAGLFVIGFGYLARQMNRLDDTQSRRTDRLEENLSKRIDRVEAKIDQLTERYITHLEHHPR